MRIRPRHPHRHAPGAQTLHLFLNRLPQPGLRDESRRRLIRLHMAASPFSEVRDHAESVEEIVMRQGVYRLSPGGSIRRRVSASTT
jgi:hypothetical protein